MDISCHVLTSTSPSADGSAKPKKNHGTTTDRFQGHAKDCANTNEWLKPLSAYVSQGFMIAWRVFGARQPQKLVFENLLLIPGCLIVAEEELADEIVRVE